MISEPEIRTLASAVELLTDLHNRNIQGHKEYVVGFVHGGTGRAPEKLDGEYADGYAAGGVVGEARNISKRIVPQACCRVPAPHPDKKIGVDSKLLTPTERREQAKIQGYTGNICQICQGSKMRRNGTCELCADCGSSSGCS